MKPGALSCCLFLGLLPLAVIVQDASAQDAASFELEGRLGRFAIDTLAPETGKWKSRVVPFLNTAAGEIHLIDDPDALLSRLSTGEHIRATGPRRDRLEATSIVRKGASDAAFKESQPFGRFEAAALNPTLGAQKTLVTLVNFPDAPSSPLSLADVQARITSSVDSVDRFVRENSAGKAWLEADFQDWRTTGMRLADIGNSLNLLLNATFDAASRTTNITLYRRIVFVLSGEGRLGFAGLGSLGTATIRAPDGTTFQSSIAWVEARYAAPGVIAHELGHNLGLYHASNLGCVPESLFDPLEFCGPIGEYGDAGDTMGNADLYHHFSSINKSALQWLAAGQVMDVSASGEYILDAAESASNGIKALRIPVGRDMNGNEIAYWAEFRSSGSVFSGDEAVQVRLKHNLFQGSNNAGNTLRPYGKISGNWITGRVTRASDGAGLENVPINVYDETWNLVLTTKSDPRGRYAAKALTDGKFYLRTQDTSGYINRYYPGTISRNAASLVAVSQWSEKPNVDFALDPGSMISGRVISKLDGRGLPSVTISACDEDNYGCTSGYTDSLGYYAVRGLADGTYRVRTYNSGDFLDEYFSQATGSAEAAPIALAQGTEAARVNFALGLGGAISGHVVSESDTKGISGVSISVYDSNWNYLQSASADSAGFYKVTGLRTGKCFVQTYNWLGFADEIFNNAAKRENAAPVEVTEGLETANVDFALSVGGMISGRVVRESDGGGIPDVHVVVGSDTLTYYRAGVTDSTGRYLINGLPGGVHYVYTSNSAGYLDEYYENASSRETATLIKVELGRESTPVDFTLAIGGIIAGRVTRKADGSGIRGVYVSAYSDSTYPYPVVTDEAGGYRLVGLRAGKYFVNTYNSQEFIDQYYPEAADRNAARQVEVVQGMETANIDFILVTGGSISGLVTRETEGTGIRNVSVTAFDARWQSIKTASSGEMGDYRIQGLPGGKYYLKTWNSRGYDDEYFDNARSQQSATGVTVIQGEQTANINFALSKSGAAVVPSAEEQQKPIPAARTRDLELSACCGHAAISPSGTEFADATLLKPFRDPYRGIQIEWLERISSGADGRARLRVTLPSVAAGDGGPVDFGELSAGQAGTRESVLTNRSGVPMKIGQLAIHGRHESDFSFEADDCSNTTLSPEQSCRLVLRFSVSNYYFSPLSGEVGLVRIPLNDPVQSLAILDLWARSFYLDLAVTQIREGTFSAEDGGSYRIKATNRGTNIAPIGVPIVDALPDGLSFISSTGDWNCTAAGQEVKCQSSWTIFPGGTSELVLKVSIDKTARSEYTNIVTISSPDDPFPENDSARDSTTLTADPTAYCPRLADGAEGKYLSLALANFGKSDATLVFSAYDRDGSLITGAGITNPASRILKRAAQLPLLDHQIWGAGLSSGEAIQWFTVQSTANDVTGMYMAFDDSLGTLDGIGLPRRPQPAFILPEMDGSGMTEIRVVNPGWSPVDLTFSLANGTGDTKATHTETLRARGAFSARAAELFPAAKPAATDYVRVSASGKVVAAESLASPGRWLRALTALDPGAGSTTLYAPQCTFGGGWWSTLTIVNLDSTPGTVDISLYDGNGSQVGATRTFSMAAGGKVSAGGSELLAPDAGGMFRGYLKIRSSGPRIAGCITFGDADADLFSSSLQLQDAAAKEFILSHVASNPTWYTGLAVLNPQDSAMTANIRLLDGTGRVVAERSEIIPAGHRLSRLLTQYFPAIERQEIASGYLRIATDLPAVVLGLFGTSDLRTLSAIAAQPIQ